MARQGKHGVIPPSDTEQERRNQEVLRANKELAAYFKGRRTEREARAALKIIKAFVRDRERRNAKSRPPLPGTDAAPAPAKAPKRRVAARSAGRQRPKPRVKSRVTPSAEALSSEAAAVSPQSAAEGAEQ